MRWRRQRAKRQREKREKGQREKRQREYRAAEKSAPSLANTKCLQETHLTLCDHIRWRRRRVAKMCRSRD